MSETFDPYHKWLGIAPKDQPPNHYRLLGVDLFESDPDVLAAAADQRMAHVKSFANGAYSVFSQQILNELAAARLCLLNADKRSAYDATLASLVTPQPAPPQQIPVPPPPTTDSPSSWQSAPAPVPDFGFISQSTKPTKKPAKASYVPALVALACLVAASIGVLAFTLSKSKPEVAEADSLKAKKSGDAEAKVEPKTEPKAETKVEPKAAQNVVVAKVDPKVAVKVQPKVTPPVHPDVKPEAKPEATPAAEPEVVKSEATPEDKPKGKLAVPDAAAQEKSLATIRSVYAEDAKSDKAALAKKLVRTARETQDSADRYVMLRTAKTIATDTGQGALAFAAADQMASDFGLSASELKAEVIATAAKLVHGPDQKRALAEAALLVIDDAVREENFEAARSAGKQATQLAQSCKDKDFVQRVAAKNKDIETAAKTYGAVQKAMATLKATPADQDANAIVGNYFCFRKGDWDQGLPMLAKSNDAKVSALAAADEKGATDSRGMVQLGDAWWAAGGKQRAAYWYKQALPELNGPIKDKADKRVAEAASEDPKRSAMLGDPARGDPASDSDIHAVRVWNVKIPCARTETKVHTDMAVSPRGVAPMNVSKNVLVRYAEMAPIRARFVDYKNGKVTLRYEDGQLPAQKLIDYKRGVEYTFLYSAFSEADKAFLKRIKEAAKKKSDGVF
jgi:hypothetical protein